MRKENAPDVPFVSVELAPDGTLVQARLASNRLPSDEIYNVIHEWVGRCLEKEAA